MSDGGSPLAERAASDAVPLAELSARISRCPDLDALLRIALTGLDELFGYPHSLLLLIDERGTRLSTIASHGYSTEGVGSEAVVGEGVIGMAAARAAPMRVGNLRHMRQYSAAVRRSYEESGEIAPGREIPLPGLADPGSQVAVPAMVRGQLLGILAIESSLPLAFTEEDEARVGVIATLLASAIEIDWAEARAEAERVPTPGATPVPPAASPGRTTHVRFFPVDGSTFLDRDYLIKGVAGRILWVLLGHYTREGRDEFTNKEVRLDPALELPEFRDNLESRLILLKRRLDEREAPIRMEKTGRGRFRLVVDTALRLDEVR